ncbi:glycosyltransferase [bacterium]|nr:glycosyltransferase [bacterium]
MPKPAKIIIFFYNRFFDPVIQSNCWLYVRALLEENHSGYQFHLITYEDDRFPLSPEQRELVERWKSLGLEWTPLRWHPGTSLKSKGMDLLAGFRQVARLRLKGYRHIISLASVAGAYAYLYCLPLRLRLFMYQFEPHSEYALDNKMWRPDSLQYKIMHWLERRSAHYARVIGSGTRFMQARLQQEWKVKARFFKIPSVADDQKFQFRPLDRAEVRGELGLSQETRVLLYPGKFGDLYYRGETAWMYRWLREKDPTLHLVIITPHQDEEVELLFNEAGVDRACYSIVHCDYARIHRYYSAADVGIIAVPPGPSKKFISNIKVGEYLCSGLPYLITRGVSEDYCYAEEQGVGVVVDDFREKDIKDAWPILEKYFLMDPELRRSHCREVGLSYRGYSNLNPVFRQALEALTS